MLAARDDVAIELYSQPTPSQFQALQQVGHRLTVRKLVALAVQLNVHSDRHHCQGASILARSAPATKAPSAAVHPYGKTLSGLYAQIPGRQHQENPARQKSGAANGCDDAELADTRQGQQIQTSRKKHDADRE